MYYKHNFHRPLQPWNNLSLRMKLVSFWTTFAALPFRVYLTRFYGVQFSVSSCSGALYRMKRQTERSNTNSALQKHTVLCSLLLLHQKDCTWRQKLCRDTESLLVTLRVTVTRIHFRPWIGRDSPSRKSGGHSQQRQAELRCKFT